jgi:4-hydroxybenzoate polyprenyltransferase
MEFIHKRQINERLLGLGPYLLNKPGLVLMRILAVTIFALVAAWGDFAWGDFALVIGAFAAMQISITLTEVYSDDMRDAQDKSDKPVSHGFISPRVALTGSIAMIVLMALLLVPLGPLVWAISLCYLALGQVSNLKLQATPYSGIVLMLATLLIPLYAFAGVGNPVTFLFWLVPVGFLLGVALNLANALPNLEEGAKGGARTLAVLLGVKRSFIACQLLIVASATLIGLLRLTALVPAQPWVLVTILILTCLGIEAMLLFFGPEKPVETRRLYFYIVTLTCLVLAGGWMLGAIL